jgi:protein-tyrosine phosphatase
VQQLDEPTSALGPEPTMKILVVCMGNICRSPMAEAVVRSMLDSNGLAARTTVDSAGTHDFNVGLPPDPRSLSDLG